MAFTPTDKLANELRKVDKDERVLIMQELTERFCVDCGGETPENPDAPGAPELSKRCRCVIWCDE